jgi:transposase
MSTRELYHNQGGKSLTYESFETADGKTTYVCSIPDNKLVCPVCKSNNIIKRGIRYRIVKGVPVGQREVYLKIKINRIYCNRCGILRQVVPSIAEPYKSYTKRFQKCVIEDSHRMSIKSLCARYKICWDACYEIIIDDLKKRYAKIDLSNLCFLAIDEISYKRGHKYLTIVINYVLGNIIYVGEGKGAESLDDFWKQLGPIRSKKIKAVSIDMGRNYISAVQNNLPKAKIIFDHFHIVKLFNDHLSRIRRKIFNNATKEGKKVLFGVRWLLLKNPENLMLSRNEPERLKAALELNKDLYTAYLLKEELRMIWKQTDKIHASAKIDEWIQIAKNSCINDLIKMGESLDRYRYGILNWYDYQINSGKLEGLNNKIKVLMRTSYGLRNIDNLKYRLYAIHESDKYYTKI